MVKREIILHGVLPCEHARFMGKIALREDFELLVILSLIKGNGDQ